MRKNLPKGPNGLPTGQGFYWKRDVIYVAIWHQGKKLGVFSTGTDQPKKAEKFKEDKKDELIKAQDTTIADLKKGVRVSELLADYVARLESKEADGGEYTTDVPNWKKSSYKASTRINKNLVPFFGNLKPEQLTSDLLNQYKAKRRREGASVVTVNSEFRIFRAALNRGTKTTPKKVNPIHVPDFSEVINTKAEENAARTGTIDDTQYEAIMQHISAHLKPMFATAFFTGIRAKELTFVQREQVDFKTNMIHLKAGQTKNNEPRPVGMNEVLKAILLEWEAYTKENYPKTRWLFHDKGNRITDWDTAWNLTLKRAGLVVPVQKKATLTQRELQIKNLRKSGATTADIAAKLRCSPFTVLRHESNSNRKTERPEENVKYKNLVTFHDTRRTSITELDELGVSEKDNITHAGQKTVSVNRRYNQSKESVHRVLKAQNEALRAKGKLVSGPATVAPVTPTGDWKAEIKELKAMMDDGTLTAEEFATEKAKVMASR